MREFFQDLFHNPREESVSGKPRGCYFELLQYLLLVVAIMLVVFAVMFLVYR